LLPYRDPIPVASLGAFKWHTQDATWRYAVWLFEKALVLVDTAQPAYEITSLPSPTVFPLHRWEVAAVGPRGDWAVSSMPEEAGRPVVVTYGGRESALSWDDLFSWTRLETWGFDASIPIVPRLRKEGSWGILLGREMARYQWAKWSLLGFPLRNQATLCLQAPFGDAVGRTGSRILDVHPTRDDFVVIRTVVGQKFLALRCGLEIRTLRELHSGDLYSWSRLGGAVILDTCGFLGSCGAFPTLVAGNHGVTSAPVAPWEDAWGHVWAVREEHLTLSLWHYCRHTCPKGYVLLSHKY
jgi:hypothetical protein